MITREKFLSLLEYILLACMPFLCVAIILVTNGQDINFRMFIPTWNDEVGWWSQVASMVKYKQPIGYYGYNGTHAQIGTFGSWGVAPLLLYWLWGEILGWDLFSLSLANLFFLSLGIFVFCLLVKPVGKQLVWIAIMYLCMPVTIGYSMTSMAESERYSLAIILTGIIIWLEKRTKRDDTFAVKVVLQNILIILFLLYCVNVYMIFALAIPIVFWYIFKKMKWSYRISLCVGLTIVISYISNKIVGLISAPYTSSTIENILDVIRNEGIYSGFLYLLRTFFTNAETLRLDNILYQEHAILKVHFLVYVFVCILLVFVVLKRVYDRNLTYEVKIWFFALYFLLGFFVGYCALYTGVAYTLCRGINTGFVMALFFLCSYCPKTHIKRIDIKVLIMVFMLCGGIGIASYYKETIDGRVLAYQRTAEIIQESEVLSDYIELSPAYDRWDNTVAIYGAMTNWSMALPPGCGINYILNGMVNTQAKYVAIEKRSNREDDILTWLDVLVENNHRIIWEDETFYILELDD